MPGLNLNPRNTPPEIRTPLAKTAGLLGQKVGPNADAGGRTVVPQAPGKSMSMKMAQVGSFFAAPFKALASRVVALGESVGAKLNGVSVDEYRATQQSKRLDQQMQADQRAGVSGNGESLAANAEVDRAAHAKVMNQIDKQFGAGMGLRAMKSYQDSVQESAGATNAQNKVAADRAKVALGANAGTVEGRKVLEPALETHAKKVIAADEKARVHHAKYHGPAVAAMPHVAAARADALYARVNLANSGGAQNGASTREVMDFVAINLEVCSSEAFYAAETSNGVSLIIGMSASLAVVDRIVANGQATAQDLADLQRCLGPYTRTATELADKWGDNTPTPDVPPTLQGPLTSDNLAAMADLIMARYSPQFNTDDKTLQDALSTVAGSATGQEKLENVKNGFIEVSRGNGFGANSIAQGIAAVEKWARADALPAPTSPPGTPTMSAAGIGEVPVASQPT